jgi:hypothetical protein
MHRHSFIVLNGKDCYNTRSMLHKMSLHLFRSTRSGRILFSDTTDLLKSPYNKPLPPQQPIPKKKRMGWQVVPKPEKSLRFRPDLWTHFASIDKLPPKEMKHLKLALKDVCVDPNTAPAIEPMTLSQKPAEWKPWEPSKDVKRAVDKLCQVLNNQKSQNVTLYWERMDYMELTNNTWPLHVEHGLLSRNRVPWPELK